MELVIIAVALAHGVLSGELSSVAQQRWGFGLHNLWEGRLYTPFTAPFFVRNLTMLLGIVLLIGYSIGIYEWLAGTRRALLLYWVTNVLGMLLAAGLTVVPLYWVGSPLGREVALMSDVGPSAGGLGCIGGWVDRLPDRYRRWVFLAVMAYLIGKLVLFPELFADTAHLFAFPMGFALDRWLWGKRVR